MKRKTVGSYVFLVIQYIVCILLTIMCLMPFIIMLINSTRSTFEIQQHAVSLIPSSYFMSNINILLGKTFDPMRGFMNSAIISVGVTVCTCYFSALTAYALTAYDWRLRQPFFTFIMAIMMIPTQLSSIGFYKFMYAIHLTNNFIPLIIPAIAAPSTVFFMRQYLQSNLSMEIVNSARVDGSGEFRTFNQIVLPIMKPALATQGIFAFVTSWNNLFMPLILLTKNEKYTMPIMVSLLRGDIYRTEFGAIYVGLSMTVLPLLVVYFLLSKYIVAGVALGGVKG